MHSYSWYKDININLKHGLKYGNTGLILGPSLKSRQPMGFSSWSHSLQQLFSIGSKIDKQVEAAQRLNSIHVGSMASR